ncbi:class C sortase [Coprococcus phoceensis]|uniref:class C sortase n=1 Tax=Coprococcus phoceensis TaxID=1870993 RepID=UPI003567C681
MKSKKKKKKITIKDIIRLIVLLVAFSVLLYPTFSSYLNEKNGSKVVSYYDEESVKLSKAEKEQMLEDARAYNKEMLGNIDLIDPFSQEDVEIDARYESLLNVDGSGMMGYIRIPKINVELPIYHGTSEAVLQAGVGHFWGTSLPVGGESTHTVLTGHRGLPTKTLFTNMDKLEVGDIFYIKVLDETLAYQIDQILTVLPQETDSLSIEPGKDYATLVTCTHGRWNEIVVPKIKDYATLVTCTPFAINTHRLLVRGERIPYEEATKQEPDINIKPELSFTAKVLIVTIIVIFIGLMIAVIYSIRDRKRRKVR